MVYGLAGTERTALHHHKVRPQSEVSWWPRFPGTCEDNPHGTQDSSARRIARGPAGTNKPTQPTQVFFGYNR